MSRLVSVDVLTVRDTNVIISDHIYEKITLLISNKAFDMEYAYYNDKHYLRSIKNYESYEFEKLFRFSCDKYEHHKVIEIVNDIYI